MFLFLDILIVRNPPPRKCMYMIGANDIRAGEGRAGIGMRAPGSDQGRRGVSRVKLAIRDHAGTVVGERSSS